MNTRLMSDKEIIDLGTKLFLYSENRNDTKNFYQVPISYEAMHETLRTQFELIVGKDDPYKFDENKNHLYKLMGQIVDEVLPKNVLPGIGKFAEVRNFPQGTKPVFKKMVGRNRAKSFITKAALAGNYDVFRLDNTTIEVPTIAYGGACQISIEQFLDGTVDFSELLKIILDELSNAVYKEVRNAVETFAIKMPVQTANKHVVAGWDGAAMAELLKMARSYGQNAQILCTETLAQKIRTVDGYVADADKNDIRDRGYLGKYLGAPVVLLPNAYEDTTNTRPQFQDRYAYILPMGSNSPSDRIVKVALEGRTMMQDIANRDWSKEIQVYKKMGIAMVNDAPFVGIYEDTNIPFIERISR